MRVSGSLFWLWMVVCGAVGCSAVSAKADGLLQVKVEILAQRLGALQEAVENAPTRDGVLEDLKRKAQELRADISREALALAKREEGLLAKRRVLTDEKVRYGGQDELVRRIETARRVLSRTVGDVDVRCMDEPSLEQSVDCASEAIFEAWYDAAAEGGAGCGQLTFDNGRFAVSVTGIVSDQATASALERAFGSQATDLIRSEWPVCQADHVLRDALAVRDRPQLTMIGRRTTLQYGESLAFRVQGPASNAFLYLFYLDSANTVTPLRPSAGSYGDPISRREERIFGDGQQGRPRYTAQEPAGHEAIIAITSAAPIAGLDTLQPPGSRNRPIAGEEFFRHLDATLQREAQAGGIVAADIEKLIVRP